MRAGLLLSLAWADYRGEARLSLCAIFALAAVITPLLVLFGLKYGLVSTLTERLERAPSVREIIPVGGAPTVPRTSPPWPHARTSPSPCRAPGRSPPPPTSAAAARPP